MAPYRGDGVLKPSQLMSAEVARKNREPCAGDDLMDTVYHVDLDLLEQGMLVLEQKEALLRDDDDGLYFCVREEDEGNAERMYCAASEDAVTIRGV